MMSNWDTKQPLLSIIIPIFKTEKTLDRCITSIANQTYRNIEILLINGNSPDHALQISQQWQQKDSRIKIVNKEDNGVSDDRNKGIDIARGDLITFVDGDDFVETDAYENLISWMISENLDIVTCGRFINCNDAITNIVNSEQRIYSAEEAIKEVLECGKINEACWDKVYKKNIFGHLRFPIGEVTEEIILMIQLLGKVGKIGNIGRPYYHYCIEGESLTRSGYNTRKDIIFKRVDQMNDYIDQNYPRLKKSVNVICCSYSTGAMMTIYNTQHGKKLFSDSLKKYYSIIKRTSFDYFRCKNISLENKAKCFLLRIRLYEFLHSIIKALKRK